MYIYNNINIYNNIYIYIIIYIYNNIYIYIIIIIIEGGSAWGLNFSDSFLIFC